MLNGGQRANKQSPKPVRQRKICSYTQRQFPLIYFPLLLFSDIEEVTEERERLAEAGIGTSEEEEKVNLLKYLEETGLGESNFQNHDVA